MSNEFDFDTKNGWTHYADAASQEQMDVLAARYMDFIWHLMQVTVSSVGRQVNGMPITCENRTRNRGPRG